MKFSPEDILKFRGAAAACRLAGIDHAVFMNGEIRSISDNRNAAIISELKLSIPPEVKLCVLRLGELDKRMQLFGEDVLVEGELTGENKVRKLSMRGKHGKMEFRCTDLAMLESPSSEHKYPKTMNDAAGAVLTFTKPELALTVKAIKTLGAERITLQVKRDGFVHIESVDSSSDKFEADLSSEAEFIEDAYPSVHSYANGSGGVLLPLLEYLNRETTEETCQIMLMRTGNLLFTVHKHNVYAIPRIEIGAS
jgi:hypothetical protein